MTNGYEIVPLKNIPRKRNQKGDSVWQPFIDLALIHPGNAIAIKLSDHPELARIPASNRGSHLGGLARRLNIFGRIHYRSTPDSIYLWIDPPGSQQEV